MYVNNTDHPFQLQWGISQDKIADKVVHNCKCYTGRDLLPRSTLECALVYMGAVPPQGQVGGADVDYFYQTHPLVLVSGMCVAVSRKR